MHILLFITVVVIYLLCKGKSSAELLRDDLQREIATKQALHEAKIDHPELFK
jgi:hypothetical protein